MEELRGAVQAAIDAAEKGGEPGLIFSGLRKQLEHVPAGRWSPELCVEKCHEWVELHGSPPAAINWNPSAMRQRGREHLLPAWLEGDWPSLATIQRLFGSWNAYVLQAGYEPREKADPENRGPGGPLDSGRLPVWTGWQFLAHHRDRAGLSQGALAERAGISIEYYGYIERGRQTNPSVRVLLAVGLALGIGPRALMEFEVGEVEMPESVVQAALRAEGKL